MDLTERQIAAIVEWAKEKPHILEIRLFGSRFRGTSTSNSDVDLAVTIEPIRRGLRIETPFDIYMACASDWETELSEMLGLKADVERYERETAPHVWAFVSEGHHLLYVKSPANSP